MDAVELTDEERRILAGMEVNFRREGRLLRRLAGWTAAALRRSRRTPVRWLVALVSCLAAGSLVLLIEAVRADAPVLIYTFVGTWTVTLIALGALTRRAAVATVHRPHWNRRHRTRQPDRTFPGARRHEAP
ncbi:hypothetical protein [Streptomyces sp. SPB162]|uniref:hypothetical protein n=1 Tax=Streptomyces sp. SPB162 TaxID=2940560 RepID=UPI0024056D15|nr:hypothetical protein [Streptomyces sp. SPB162]MDF9811232.1 hypothetical protein [Streptomyces sp. SPB162]